MTATWLSKTKNSFRIAVQVSPNAKKSEIASAEGDALRIRLQAQPVDGKANEVLIQFIAKKLRIPRKNIAITHGFSSKRKLLEIFLPESTLEEIEKRLLSI
jgi:hypothetical protein